MPTVEVLTREEIRKVYRDCCVRDFPADELRPLPLIEAALRRGEYRCFGLKDGGEMLAYAFLARLETAGGGLYLFDFFAVQPALRNQGVGSRFLQALQREQLRDADCVLLEVDDPASTESETERELRRHRLGFYLRNGLRDSGVRSRVFDVDYVILEFPVKQPHSAAQLRDAYEAVYRAMLPPAFFREKVHTFCAAD